MHKLQENIEAEIMQVTLEDARESYNPTLIMVPRGAQKPTSIQESFRLISSSQESWI